MTAHLFIALLVATVLAVYLAIGIRTWLRLHGPRVVVCPETRQAVVVCADVGHAIATAVWEKADVRLTSCSRWPERQNCDQACAHQIEGASSRAVSKALALRVRRTADTDCAR